MAGSSGDSRARLGRFHSLRSRTDAASQKGDHEAALGLGLCLAGFLAGEGHSPEDAEFSGKMTSEAHYSIMSSTCRATQPDKETLNQANCPQGFRFSESKPTDLERIKNSKYLRNVALPSEGLHMAPDSTESRDEIVQSKPPMTHRTVDANQQSGILLGQNLYQSKLTSLYGGLSFKACEEAQLRHVRRPDGHSLEPTSKRLGAGPAPVADLRRSSDRDDESCPKRAPIAVFNQPAYKKQRPEVVEDDCDYDRYKRLQLKTRPISRRDSDSHDADDIECGWRPQTSHPKIQRGRRGKMKPEGDGVVEDAMQELRTTFITAHELAIQEAKKHNGPSTDIRNGDYGCANKTLGPAVGHGDYGCASKTLGIRHRGPGAAFVPPVKGGRANDGLSRFQSVPENGGGESTPSCLELLAGPDGQLPTRLRNIEPKLLEHIANEIMDKDPMVSWNDIAGLEHAKKNVNEMVIWPLQRPDLFRGCRAPAKGLLLFGPPGTGKTMIGKAIAGEAKATFFSISASSIMSKWLGETEKLIRALFGVAACRQPAVIFIDEVDSVLSQRRSDGENDTSRKIKTQFLVEMDGCGTGSEQVLVIGATNRPQELDEAARRRLSKRLYIPLPSFAARSWIVRNLLGKDGLLSLSDDEVDAICSSTDGYSGSDMKNLVKEASMGPLREALTSGRRIIDIGIDELRAISLQDFMTALQQVRSSVSQDDLGQYEDWNKVYGSLS